MTRPHHTPSPPSPQPVGNHRVCSESTAFPDIIRATISFFSLFSINPSSSSCQGQKANLSSFLVNRRLPRIPFSISMSNPNSTPGCHQHPFPTPQSLSNWLQPRLPSDSFASWGVRPGTKNIHNLWLEISEGETFLADSSPPIRTVNVVAVRIMREDLVLVESHQELSDGTVRKRSRPLSEKIKPGETPEAAVARAVKEELGSVLEESAEIKIVPGSYAEKVEERYSVSYPGLPARYVLHSFDVILDGLPQSEFATEEQDEYGDSTELQESKDLAVYVKRHFWKWVRSDSVKP